MGARTFFATAKAAECRKRTQPQSAWIRPQPKTVNSRRLRFVVPEQPPEPLAHHDIAGSAPAEHTTPPEPLAHHDILRPEALDWMGRLGQQGRQVVGRQVRPLGIPPRDDQLGLAAMATCQDSACAGFVVV